jgi:hypothetical protein
MLIGTPNILRTQYAENTPFDNSINGFTADNVQTAIEEAKQTAEGLPRAVIRSVYNGTLPNNSWIGPTDLLSNTPLLVLPINAKLQEISWANQNTNRAFTIKFYKNGKLAGDLFYTLTVTSPNPGYGYVTGLNYNFNAGDVIYAYSQTTTSPSDTSLELWILRTI